MIRYGIERRDCSSAAGVHGPRLTVDELQELMEGLKPLEPVVYEPKPRTSLFIPVPYSGIRDKVFDCTLTLVMSDLHLGDADHLPDSYWSTISNVLEIMRGIMTWNNVRSFKVVLNGDIVSGRNVYRGQEFRNLLSRGHWQVFLAEEVLKRTFRKIEELVPIEVILLTKGQHEPQEENYALYLRKIFGDRCKYGSKSIIYNIASPLGFYNVLFTHGTSRSEYYPVSYALIRDIWKTLSENDKVPVERIVCSHSHWLTPDIQIEGFKVSVTGGYQRWEYSIHQRPAGMILLYYANGEAYPIAIPPDRDIEHKEKSHPALEYRNLKYYAEMLMGHLREEEKVP